MHVYMDSRSQHPLQGASVLLLSGAYVACRGTTGDSNGVLFHNTSFSVLLHDECGLSNHCLHCLCGFFFPAQRATQLDVPEAIPLSSQKKGRNKLGDHNNPDTLSQTIPPLDVVIVNLIYS